MSVCRDFVQKITSALCGHSCHPTDRAPAYEMRSIITNIVYVNIVYVNMAYVVCMCQCFVCVDARGCAGRHCCGKWANNMQTHTHTHTISGRLHDTPHCVDRRVFANNICSKSGTCNMNEQSTGTIITAYGAHAHTRIPRAHTIARSFGVCVPVCVCECGKHTLVGK